MSKFTENLKAITGYKAVHKAIMQDVFERHAYGDGYSSENLPTIERLQNSGFIAAALASPFGGEYLKTTEMLAPHPLIAMVVSVVALGSAAIAAALYLDFKIDEKLNCVSVSDAKDILEKGEVATVREAASLGRAFLYNNWFIGKHNELSVADRSSKYGIETVTAHSRQNQNIAAFAVQNGLVSPHKAIKLASAYQAAMLG